MSRILKKKVENTPEISIVWAKWRYALQWGYQSPISKYEDDDAASITATVKSPALSVVLFKYI